MTETGWNAVTPFEKALLYAYQQHDGQFRKGTKIPYISHLLAVSSIVLENGGTETEAIAALQHDVIEDQLAHAARQRVTDEIKEHFGNEVLAIVEGCSDTVAASPVAANGDKIDWKIRKDQYLEHLRHAPPSMRLVSASDKLHNARAILADYREIGDALWGRFNAGKDSQLWYYRSLVKVFQETQTTPKIIEELNRVVSEIERLAM